MDQMKLKPQLFLLHFAGGNRYSFQRLLPYLKHFDVVPLELPGRGKRMGEALLIDYRNAINDYFNQLSGLLRSPDYLIYGHSMGATLGLLLTKKLEEANKPPLCLVVSGNAGPGSDQEKTNRYLMPRNEFVAELRKLGGVPNEFFEHDELFDFFEPIIRSDFEILEKEDILLKEPVQTPVYAMMGNLEKQVNQLENWGRLTTGSFHSQIVKGDHFFIHQQAELVADRITRAYEENSTVRTEG
jgi:external thioesterase TEII